MSYDVCELAQLIQGEVLGDVRVKISSLAPIESSKVNEITFLSDKKYNHYLNDTKASVIVTSKELAVNPSKTYIIVKNPKQSFIKIAKLFEEKVAKTGISDFAVVSKSATLAKNCYVDAQVVIGDSSKVGLHTMLMANTVIGKNVIIGDHCVIYPNVTLYDNTIIGSHVVLHAGVVIGADGFGYSFNGIEHVKIPHLGNVVIEDHVEIGANTTIDRAAMGVTLIKRGTKIDNLVQIGHNVEIGENCILCAMVGVGGSSKIGNRVIIGGNVGIKDHITIGDDVMIGAKSGVGDHVKSGERIMGIPAKRAIHFWKTQSYIDKLPEMNKAIKQLLNKERSD